MKNIAERRDKIQITRNVNVVDGKKLKDQVKRLLLQLYCYDQILGLKAIFVSSVLFINNNIQYS